MQLQLAVLGKPYITCHDQSLTQSLTADLVSAKGQALLIYLAVTGRPHSRTALAGLLWGDMPEETARANLRLTLSKLRKFLPAEILQASRLEIGLTDFWLDTSEFQKRLEVGDWRLVIQSTANHQSPLDLYRGDFLDDFYLPNAPDFEEWVTGQREQWRHTAVTGLSKWLNMAGQQNDHTTGIPLARKLLAIEPWHEESHRHLMRLLAASGQRSAALAQYETCRRLLADELGIEPTTETTALFESIRDDKVTPIAAIGRWQGDADWINRTVNTDHSVALSPLHPFTLSLPRPLTPFVGRRAELEHLGMQLLDPNCRLLTVMGMGGMGKTRLALELAATAVPHFPDGVVFVDLSSLAGSELLVTAVTDALNLPLTRSTSPEMQLADYLAPRHLLLVLDNFESVLDGTTLVGHLLAAAPRLSLLITSREPLDLHGEWLYPLGGLALPDETGGESAPYADALDFFARCARRTRPQFSLAEELPGVIDLCHLTGGMPLALELAASWTKTLTVAEIVAEIRQDLDILQARQANRPERQRSIQAILNQTWQRLTAEEQAVFARLAVFQGPFDRPTARQVAGADLGTLTNLLDKALLQRRQQTHYTMHPLVRQFGYGRLQAIPTTFAETQAAYATAYADFCSGRLPQLIQRDLPTLAALKQEQDNIRAVWEWAVAHQEVAVLAKMAQPLALYLAHYSYYQEHYRRFDTAVTALTPLSTPDAQRVLAYALLELGNAHMISGKLADADAALQASETLYAQLAIAHAPGLGTDPSVIRSIVAWMRSDFVTAVQLGEKALAQARAEQNPRNEAYAHFVMSGASIALGSYTTAQDHARQAFALAQPLNDPWFLGYCHMELGKSALALADFAAADDHFETAFALPQKVDNLTGMAMARLMLGESQRRQGKWDGAAQAFGEARQIYQDIHHRMGLARAYAGLGDAATGQGQWAQARDYYLQGLKLVVAAGLHTYANTVLVGVGEWLWAVGEEERGVAVLTAVAQDPLVSVDLQERALRKLTAVSTPPDGPSTNTFQLAATLAAELEQMTLPL
ncbi:MAG: tetratricopeptide repeat protein [Anaerolineae bacterium]|nr:tetratricopeptide repeat protein [Anaerolineae bacterium]